MKSSCLICGAPAADGFLCEKCGKPRRASTQSGSTPVPQPGGKGEGQLALDPFPKAPVVPFPIESTSLAVTSICEVLAAANVASILIGSDRSVRFVSDDARRLLGADTADVVTTKLLEATTGIRLRDLTQPASGTFPLANRPVKYNLVPLTGGFGGAVLVLRLEQPFPDQTPFANYVRETVLIPLRSLHDSLAAARSAGHDHPLVQDAVITLDQILSSLELASNVEEPLRRDPQPIPKVAVSDLVKKVADQFRPAAERRSIALQVDTPELPQTFDDESRLRSALQTLLENSIHYVPERGQIVIGARVMEHRERSFLLFFVMDNGPMVPEEYRKSIFDPGFVWDPASPDRTGKGLAKCRQLALDHGGQAWVESRSGKACTFFLRVLNPAADA